MAAGEGAWPQGRPRAFAFLPRFLFERRLPAWQYVLLAWPIVAVPALVLGWLTSKAAPTLAGPEFGHAPFWVIALAVVGLSPIVETLIMSGPVALIRSMAGPTAAAMTSSVLWGIAHSLAAARWGLVIWWPFLIFSIAYLTWAPRGYWRAIGVVFAIHALNNAGPILAVLLVR